MTRDDIKNTLAYMMFIFPEFKVPNEKIVNYTLDIWERALKNRTEEEVKEAIYQHYITSRWTPHLSDIIKILNKADRKGLPSANEMTSQAYEALVNRSHYESESPYEGLDPLTIEAIKTYGGFEALSKDGGSSYARKQFTEHCEGILERFTDETVKSLASPTKPRDAAEEALEWLTKDLEERMRNEDS